MKVSQLKFSSSGLKVVQPNSTKPNMALGHAFCFLHLLACYQNIKQVISSCPFPSVLFLCMCAVETACFSATQIRGYVCSVPGKTDLPVHLVSLPATALQGVDGTCAVTRGWALHIAVILPSSPPQAVLTTRVQLSQISPLPPSKSFPRG